MVAPEEFSHDEIVFSDVDTPEDNWYRIKVSVPAEQVDNFLFALVRAAEENAQDVPSPEEAAKLLINLCWGEFAHRSNLHESSSPQIDLSAVIPLLKPSTEFVACLEGALNPPCSLQFLEKLHIPTQDFSVDDYLIDQEISSQRVLLGEEIPFEYPIQRGDTLEGRLVVSNPDTTEEVFSQFGSLTVPLFGDHFSFETIVFDESIGSFLEKSDLKLTGAQNCSSDLQKHFGLPSVQFSFTTSSARRCKPASIEAVLTHYDMTTDSELRSAVRNAIENRSREKSKLAREATLCDELLKFAPPLTSREKSMIKKSFVSSAKNQHADSGKPDNEFEVFIEEMWSKSQVGITNAAVLNKFINLLMDQLQVGYSEDNLLHEIRLRAEAQGVRPEELRKKLVDSDQLAELQSVAAKRALFQELLRRTNSDN